MTLSAIVVTHNSSDVVLRCLRSVRSRLPGAELIVVDNASTDDTAQRCRELDGVRLFPNAVNVGYGRACNLGADAAGGSHLLLLNPDVEIVDADLSALEREQRSSPFGLLAPVQQWRAGGRRAVRHWTFDLLTHVFDPLWPRELPALPHLPVGRRQSWPTGAALLVDREEFLGLGGFDRRFFLYYEDVDLARRYWAAGLPVRTTDAVRARHQGGTSSTGNTATAALLQGWSYLSWIEYLCTWNGRETAVRATKLTGMLRRQVYRGLGLSARFGPASERVRRKRLELAELDQFVWQKSTSCDVTAAAEFYPQARAIVTAQRRVVER